MRLAAGVLLVSILCPVAILGDELPIIPETLLPPVIEWHGASENLVAGPGEPWQTPAEANLFEDTPTYAETMAWLERLAATTSRLQLVPLGESWEGRTIWLAVASAEGGADPATISASRKTVLFAQAGIHSGEIDGKDAGLMLLRDLTVGPLSHLLDRVSVLFIPILNVDGHERVSPFSRVNQRGPSEMGWRTNARNLNLNRDYAKLDTPEIRAVVEVLDRWQPDLYLDLHVTDGVEKQPDVTWGFNGSHAHSPAIGQWLEEKLNPALTSGLAEMGHIPGPHLFVFDPTDLEKGVWFWEGGPRYSDGYGSARHVATVLVENHSLKPYRQRVLGTRVLLETAINLLAESGSALRKATAVDRARRWRELPLGFSRNQTPEPEPFEFLAVEHQLTPSAISGDQRIQWTGQPITVAVPAYRTTHPLGTVVPAAAYWVPAAWPQVIERLAAHGIHFEVLEQPRSVEVEVYRLGSPTYGDEPFEGRLRVEAEATPERMTRNYARGSVRVPVDQPLGVLATLLLEPESPDSFFQWGFFSEVFQRTEYAEAYVLEPLAEQMLEADPVLRAEFAARLASDEEFAASPRQRLGWFYERSPLLDSNWRLYPVGREMP
jgi:murein tripeptide amidase MpaA